MCDLTLESADRETLIALLREAPSRSEYNAVCLALRQQTRRNNRAKELLGQLVNSAGAFDMEDVERIVNEAHAILRE